MYSISYLHPTGIRGKGVILKNTELYLPVRLLFIIITLFKVGIQTQLIANKNQITKVTKCLYNVKREVIHTESISKMLQILGILADHIASRQLDTIKSQVIGDYMILKSTKKNKNYGEIGSKCATVYISHTHSQYF